MYMYWDVMLGTLAQSVKVFKAEQSLTTWVFPQELHDRRRKEGLHRSPSDLHVCAVAAELLYTKSMNK